jgi:hypothetical protein
MKIEELKGESAKKRERAITLAMMFIGIKDPINDKRTELVELMIDSILATALLDVAAMFQEAKEEVGK